MRSYIVGDQSQKKDYLTMIIITSMPVKVSAGTDLIANSLT